MKSQKGIVALVLMATLCLLAACVPATSEPEPITPDSEQLAMVVAETLAAQQTQAAFDTMVAQLTGMAQVLSQTPTSTPVPTETPTSTVTPVLPSSTPTLSPTATVTPSSTFTPNYSVLANDCNRAQFVSDLSVPDGTAFSSGEGFTKTWRLKNVGSCPWTADYALVFVGGNAMGGPSVTTLGATVFPGDTVNLSINLVAPAGSGEYVGSYMLRNSGNGLFGIGASGSTAFWVKINVSSSATSVDPNVPLDFAASYCSAAWQSSVTTLNCPSNPNDFINGSVTRTNAPRLEIGYQDDEQALITIPADGSNGLIQGRYPAIVIQNGDRFQALVGCMDASPNCNVTFQLNYSANGGPVYNLGSWTELYDGGHTRIDADLSGLAGQSVEMILTVLDNNSSSDDRAFWLSPRLRR
jgi:hypothetical protein